MTPEPILDSIADQIGVHNILHWLINRPEMETHWAYSRIERPYFLVVGDEATPAWRGAEREINLLAGES